MIKLWYKWIFFKLLKGGTVNRVLYTQFIHKENFHEPKGPAKRLLEVFDIAVIPKQRRPCIEANDKSRQIGIIEPLWSTRHIVLNPDWLHTFYRSCRIIEPININRYQSFLKCPLNANDRGIFGWHKLQTWRYPRKDAGIHSQQRMWCKAVFYKLY